MTNGASGTTAARLGTGTGETTEPQTVREPTARWSPARLLVGEALVSLAAAGASVLLARSIDVDPLDRIGQVSGLAGLGLHFVLLGLAVLAGLGACTRWAGPAVASTVRTLTYAALAGLVTGLVAGGLVVALRGTTWPLFANNGDSRVLAGWASDLLAGRDVPSGYPPLGIWALAAWSHLTGDAPAASLKALQVIGTAIFGPLAYLGWRLVLSPVWALVLVLVAAMPLVDSYKPYTNIVVVVMLPLVIRLLGVLRQADVLSWKRLALWGAGGGAALGVLFLLYSGWFVWSAPGVLVATICFFPWRRAPGHGAVVLLAASVAFVAVSVQHLVGLLTATGGEVDRYFYFDTSVQPAYIAMWRTDLPGTVGTWPPPGELAGMGLVSALLVVGLAVALFVGRHRTDVLVLAACLAGAWVLRLYLAARMWADNAVQLYPRTTPEILFCLLALGVLAIMLSIRGVFAWLARVQTASGYGGLATSRPSASAGIAVVAAALLAGLFTGTATADRYMPRNDGSVGYLAYVAHHVRQLDGSCAAYAPVSECLSGPREVDELLRR